MIHGQLYLLHAVAVCEVTLHSFQFGAMAQSHLDFSVTFGMSCLPDSRLELIALPLSKLSYSLLKISFQVN